MKQPPAQYYINIIVDLKRELKRTNDALIHLKLVILFASPLVLAAVGYTVLMLARGT